MKALAALPRLPRVLAIAAAFALLGGCAAYRPLVRSDYDHSVDFSRYRTFGFPEKTGTDRGGYQTLVTSHFKEAVRREMSARGYVYAEQSPELLVNFYSEVQDKTQVYTYPYYPPAFIGTFGYYRGRPRYGLFSAWPFYYPYYPYPEYDVVQYQSGRLKIDIVDAARKQVVWEASVEERLTDEAQDNPQPMIDRLVAEMFRKFPRGANAP